MDKTHDQSEKAENEELRNRRKAAKAEQPKRGLTSDAAVPPEVQTSTLADPRFSASANWGRKSQILLGLQRTHGNAYVRRMMAQGGQLKDDERVVPPEVAERIESARGGGRALDSSVRDEMEATFEQELGDVKVHADAEADELARQLGARAFTTGKDVFFEKGAYDPKSEAGRKTLGHELAHVVQQPEGGDGQSLAVSQPMDAAEVEAAEAGSQLAAPVGHDPISVETSAPASTVQRQGEPDLATGLGNVVSGIGASLARTMGAFGATPAPVGATPAAPARPSTALLAMWNASVVNPVNEARTALTTPIPDPKLARDKIISAGSVVSSLLDAYPEDPLMKARLAALGNALVARQKELNAHVGITVPLASIGEYLAPETSAVGVMLKRIGELLY